MAVSKVLALFPAASRTASSDGDAFSTAFSTKPYTGDDRYSRAMTVSFGMTSISAAITVDVAVEGRNPSGLNTWYALTPNTAWTSLTAAGEQTRTFLGPIYEEVRLVQTITGAGTIASSAEAVVMQ